MLFTSISLRYNWSCLKSRRPSAKLSEDSLNLNLYAPHHYLSVDMFPASQRSALKHPWKTAAPEDKGLRDGQVRLFWNSSGPMTR